MTPEELKAGLAGKNLPTVMRLSEWEYIGNVQGFLNAEFQLVEQAGARYESTPAWERLMRFREVIQTAP